MSRRPPGRGAVAVPSAAAYAATPSAGDIDPAATGGTTNGSADDICPVCKTIRYLNKDMVFLINPACYHPMCSTCVARLFTGPNQCPYAGCHQTLRRKDFRRPFFDDLAVEREVDIRRRVAAVFNQTEDDFESLDAYNEYLEKHQREGLLAAEEQALQAREGTPIGGGGGAAAAAAGNNGNGGLTIRGLKDKRKAAAGAAAEGPYDPFEGLDPPPARFRVQPGPYRNPWLQNAREHTSHVVGGYDVHEYCARALFEAFSGLAVFVGDEKEAGPGLSAAEVATLGASLAAVDPSESLPIKMEVDVA
ncbi:cdk-activating kinase assembly factor mat1 [Niveomyces insectorum RCEF 264]|uniref:Cdk-activating kinase assembly factor mat1 n=1 Tax=Niveomyces insectorum RCEF 264 TaxID=1081102 RepID=A0A167UY02_9HYPO|nr:cdk-activating kinase assembly factor mat1 [Niveomyces insectorum RCEF 264]